MIYYKELTSTFMEASKSQDLQGELPSWSPRIVVLVWIQR
jgi:hypothetical protein